MQVEEGLTMSRSVRVHGPDYTHAICMSGQGWKQFADFDATVTTATESEG